MKIFSGLRRVFVYLFKRQDPTLKETRRPFLRAGVTAGAIAAGGVALSFLSCPPISSRSQISQPKAPIIDPLKKKRSNQKLLDRFVARLEKMGDFKTADLLGGKVLFVSVFNNSKLRLEDKDSFLEKVNRSDIPRVYKVYGESGRAEKIYIVVPDHYLSYIRDKNSFSFLRVAFFRAFARARCRLDIQIAEKAASKANEVYKDGYVLKGKGIFLQIGQALSLIRTNFQMREYIMKNMEKRKVSKSAIHKIRLMADRDLKDSVKMLKQAMRALNKRYSYTFQAVVVAGLMFLRKEFAKLSPKTQASLLNRFGNLTNPGF